MFWLQMHILAQTRLEIVPGFPLNAEKIQWFAETLPANILSWRLGCCSSLKHSVNQRTYIQAWLREKFFFISSKLNSLFSGLPEETHLI